MLERIVMIEMLCVSVDYVTPTTLAVLSISDLRLPIVRKIIRHAINVRN